MFTPETSLPPEMSSPDPMMAGGAPMNDVLPVSTASPEAGMPAEAPNPMVAELEAHLDQLPDPDKAFLAEHLTPEFVRAIGLINGPEVAQYLNQFADPEKVLVPVPRQVAEQYMKEQQPVSSPAPSQPSAPPMGDGLGSPSPAPSGGMMAPSI